MKKTLMGAVAGALFAFMAFSMTAPERIPGGAEARTNANVYKQLDLFSDVFDLVRSKYVEEPADADLIKASINGMLTSLDPHSSYMDAEQYADMRVATSGEYGGLGIEIVMEDGLIKVISPIEGTPAERAGILPGDKISHIDGEPIKGMTITEAIDHMRGEAGEQLTITVIRKDMEPFDVTLERAIITVQSVRSRVIDEDIAYLRISSFSEPTEGGLNKAMAKLKRELGPNNMKGLIIDLRSNPGGLLDQAVAVSDAFLEQGEIVSTRGRQPRDNQRFDAGAGDLADGRPIVVLINGGSASASEIVAGALKDHERATLMGTKSFGKGSVQTVLPLNNGADGALRLTTAKYYTPSGISIHEVGIEPDIHIDYIDPDPEDENASKDNQLDDAVKFLHELSDGAAKSAMAQKP